MHGARIEIVVNIIFILSICLRNGKNTLRSLKGPFLIIVSIYRARIIPCMSQRTSSSAMTDLKRICV